MCPVEATHVRWVRCAVSLALLFTCFCFCYKEWLLLHTYYVGSSAAFPSSAATITELYEAPVDGDATENVVITPGARFCHVGVVYDNAFYIFGGYDGANRLNDFLRFQFDQLDRCESEVHHEGSSGASLAASATSESPASSSLIQDLKGYVNSELLSDIQFVVEGRIIYAHQMLCRRCPVFDSMFTSQFRERDADCIPIPDVKYETFLLLLEYLYTDAVTITMDTAMDLFQVADQYAIDRLKDLCEQKMLLAIDVDTAAHILLTADLHNAQVCASCCFLFRWMICMLTRNVDVSMSLLAESAREVHGVHLTQLRPRVGDGVV